MRLCSLALCFALVAPASQAAIYELTDVPYTSIGNMASTNPVKPIDGYYTGWFELDGPIHDGMTVTAWEIARFPGYYEWSSSHLVYDNDTAFVAVLNGLTRISFNQRDGGVWFDLPIGAGVEIDKGTLPVQDGGSSGFVVLPGAEIEVHSSRHQDVSAAPEAATWVSMLVGLGVLLGIGKLRRNRSACP